MKHTSLSKTIFIILITVVMSTIAACSSIPENVSEDLTKEEIIQLAQDSYDAGKTRAAEFYYQLIIDRFGDDISSRITAQYELAHLKVKAKDWNEARPMLEEIFSYYDEDETLLLTIPEYYKLAQMDMAKLPQK